MNDVICLVCGGESFERDCRAHKVLSLDKFVDSECYVCDNCGFTVMNTRQMDKFIKKIRKMEEKLR